MNTASRQHWGVLSVHLFLLISQTTTKRLQLTNFSLRCCCKSLHIWRNVWTCNYDHLTAVARTRPWLKVTYKGHICFHSNIFIPFYTYCFSSLSWFKRHQQIKQRNWKIVHIMGIAYQFKSSNLCQSSQQMNFQLSGMEITTRLGTRSDKLDWRGSHNSIHFASGEPRYKVIIISGMRNTCEVWNTYHLSRHEEGIEWWLHKCIS